MFSIVVSNAILFFPSADGSSLHQKCQNFSERKIIFYLHEQGKFTKYICDMFNRYRPTIENVINGDLFSAKKMSPCYMVH